MIMREWCVCVCVLYIETSAMQEVRKWDDAVYSGAPPSGYLHVAEFFKKIVLYSNGYCLYVT